MENSCDSNGHVGDELDVMGALAMEERIADEGNKVKTFEEQRHSRRCDSRESRQNGRNRIYLPKKG